MKKKSILISAALFGFIAALGFIACDDGTTTEIEKEVIKEVTVPTQAEKDIYTYGYGLLVSHVDTGADAVFIDEATLTGTADLSTEENWSGAKVITITFAGVASGNITLNNDSSKAIADVVDDINTVLDANDNLFVHAEAGGDGDKFVVLKSYGIPADFVTSETPEITVGGAANAAVFGSPTSAPGEVIKAVKDSWVVVVLGARADEASEVTIRINGDADSDTVVSISNSRNILQIADDLEDELDTAIGLAGLTEYAEAGTGNNVVQIEATAAGVVVDPITSISLSIARP